MKYIVKIFVITFLVFQFNYSFAEDKIVFINMDGILKQSKAGKSIQLSLEKLHKKNLNNLKKREEILKNKEKDLLAKKNIINKEEYENLLNQLRTDAREFQDLRRTLSIELTEKRTNGTKQILDSIKPILAEYTDKNSISMIIEKKNIVVGKSELNITEEIMEILDKKVSSIKLD